MTVHNPPHPGEFIAEVYLQPNRISGRVLAAALDVSASTLNRILNGSRHQPGDGVTPFKGARTVAGKLACNANQLRSLA